LKARLRVGDGSVVDARSDLSDHELQKHRRFQLSDVVIEAYDYNGFPDPEGKMALIRSDPFLNQHIEAMTPILEIFAMIQYSYNGVPIARQVQLRASLQPIVEPEIKEATAWSLEFRIPFALLEEHVGPLGEIAGQTWRGNFFKCAEENSHPHWAAWSPVDEFNFHLPRCFGELRFA
jgi:hypothetical protein